MAKLTQMAKRIIEGRLVQPLLSVGRRAAHFGTSCYCPVCRSHLRRFLPYGRPPRPGARCPICGCLERHRLIWLYFQRSTDLFDGRPKRMLHVAPEARFARVFEETPYIDYVSGDMRPSAAMVELDITDIHYPQCSFDVIYCSHVLEHVPDDRRAMSELLRVLTPGGWAALQVPIMREKTYEDPSAQTPEERERVFGQWDHVRIYGRDFQERLESAGFAVTVDRLGSEFDARRRRYHGLMADDNIYLCRKVPEAKKANADSLSG